MAYRLKTFQVQFVAEPVEFPAGSPCRASNDAERLARSIYQRLDADKEHFVLLTLNNKNRVNGFKVVSTGSLTASLVHPREVWRAALHLCAAAVIFVHNHPSGDPTKPGRSGNHPAAQGNGRHARNTGARSHCTRTRTLLLVQRQGAVVAVLPLPSVEGLGKLARHRPAFLP
jgi:RadC-like JAB domain